jgi:2-dehydro-3-deoxy-D-arabinonate dehydratase
VPLCRYLVADSDQPRLGFIVGDRVIDSQRAGGPATMRRALEMSRQDLLAGLAELAGRQDGVPVAGVTLRAPIDEQEVWAAGVTYLRSRDARMEESTQKDVYDQVYEAERPELFFKATAARVAGPGEHVAIRADSTWDVPEPELALAINALGEVVGFTVGNDVSSRSIEGENPLYLPQAKLYARSASLGPVVATVDEVATPGSLDIRLTIRRDGSVLFQEQSSTARMHRSFDDLVAYLLRHNEYPAGVFLMTGTGIVPPSEFTLQDGDEVTIDIPGVGTLVNPVLRLPT